MTGITQEILLYGSQLSLGENIRVTCPTCGGGNSRERNTLSITLEEDGTLIWQCFRASCSERKGNSASDHKVTPSNQVAKKKPRRVFEGTTQPLRERDLEWIKNKYEIDNPEYWYYTPDYGGRIAMSIRSPKFTHRGWSLKAINPNAAVKTLTYVDEGEEGISWYKTQPYTGTIIVEDIPSAVRAAKYLNAVALLGTGVGLERATEIAEYAPRPIIVALDQDATKLSYKWARKYALLWEDVEVLRLEKDIKDMSEEEVCQKLSRYVKESL